MKFAKELEREAVPEWRIKYLNYKTGKKHVKAVTRAIHRATLASRISHRRNATVPAVLNRLRQNQDDDDLGLREAEEDTDQWSPKSKPIDIKSKAENEGLTRNSDSLQYGSFVPTPPSSSWPMKQDGSSNDELHLPSPAIAPQEPSEQPSGSKSNVATRKSLAGRFAGRRSQSSVDVPRPKPSLKPRIKDDAAAAAAGDLSSPIRRIISHSREISTTFSRTGNARQSLDLVRKHEQDFFAFMESELQKVETFYRQKEEQAGKRLDLLREQLHEMRNRRIQEISPDDLNDGNSTPVDSNEEAHDKFGGWVQPLKTKFFPPGPNSKGFKDMAPTPQLAASQSSPERSKDYIRRSTSHQISYRTAKRKLKRAVLEFYRSLELLKSYAMLNRTAFRKLNKKFDKAVHAQPSLRFVTEKVNKSYFVNSHVLEEHIKTVEDLYSRYFEHGNQKLAAGKLRRLTKKPKDESGSAFMNGVLLGTGLVFAIQGLVYGNRLLYDEDHLIRLNTTFLMQIYGGYFLMLLLFSLFCINCFLWTKSKVNYPFIFEFDQRTQLDWRQLAEFPCFCLLLLGVVMWANFSRYGNDEVFLYYPVILIAVTVFMILLPAPVLAYRSRKWFAFSHGRLLLAGLYPVEFRDFFLGDMYCSLTYAMANVELFFCLYARNWKDPLMCSSSHSRLLGFLTTLPPIWRFLQCIRRYRDTKNVFPHLVNCGKYSMSIMGNVCLSLYRIHRSDTHLALFITFNIINGIYCAIWDLFMDFSLLQPESRHSYLRDIIAFKRRWIYYAIMTVDPIFRFSWILYAFFTYDSQHSTLISFMVGFIEVVRRAMWALLRVENEHCSNVSQYKASRDVPLPYRIEPLLDHSDDITMHETIDEESGVEGETQKTRPSDDRSQGARSSIHQAHAQTSSVSLSQVESQVPRQRHRSTTLHRRMGSRAFSQVLAEAHKQDFERKRRPDDEVGDGIVAEEDHSDEDDEDDEDLNSFMDVRTPGTLSRADSAV